MKISGYCRPRPLQCWSAETNLSISGYCHPRPLQCWNAHVSGETWPTETLSQKQSARVPLATLKERAGQGLKSCLSHTLLLATFEEGGGGGLRRIHALSLQHWGRGHGGSEEYIEHKSGHSCSSSIFHSRVHVPCRLQIIQVNIGEGGSTKSVAQRCSDIDHCACVCPTFLKQSRRKSVKLEHVMYRTAHARMQSAAWWA